MSRPRACRHLPTLDELLLAPDVAILDALGAAIDVALVAVVAQQPQLWPTADRPDGVSLCAGEGEAAAEVIRSAQALVMAITVYRSIVTSRRI